MVSLAAQSLASLCVLRPSSHHPNRNFVTPRCHFSPQIHQEEDVPFITQYLISSLDFSEDRALKLASDNVLCRIKTPERPDSVIRFLKDIGMTDIQIKSVISLAPQLLHTNARTTLEPRAREVINGGFSSETLVQLIQYNPRALIFSKVLSRLQFWRSFFNDNEDDLSKFIKRNYDLLTKDIDKTIIPRINLLHGYGLSDQQIATLTMGSTSSLMRRNLDTIKKFLERTENLGFERGSGMFVRGLIVVASLSEETMERKINFLRNTYNWSEEEVNSAIKKFPSILALSVENVKSTMDFLVTNCGFDPKMVASQPLLIILSLKRRLMPRHYVITTLKSKGLDIKSSFCTVASMAEKKFVEKFIVAYKKEVPELGDSYAAFRGEKV